MRSSSTGSGNPEAVVERSGVRPASVQQDAALNLDIIFLAPAAVPGRRRQRHGSGSPLLRPGSQPWAHLLFLLTGPGPLT
ncbi:hypothetical protein MTO96_000031 [Rhipicephalus appendiculatus]